MTDPWQKVQPLAESWSPQEVLQWAFDHFGEHVEIASGFGVEGMTLIDMASRIKPDLKVFTGDTEFLFAETYQLIERAEKRYGITVERIRSAFTPEQQEKIHGAALWKTQPDRCCNLRKIEPLRRKLSTLNGWITAIRRDQTPTRASAMKVEWDVKFDLVKINPIADWTSKMVWNYVFEHNVPYNPLHDRDYPSIGCTHCTRAVVAGEDPRAGRWAGLEKKECGLHAGDPAPVGTLAQI